MNSFRDNSIGTDPTSIPVIENLDAVPKSKKKKDENGPIKKIIFVILIVVLMLGVGFGLYYYLRLGQNNKKTSNFTLNEITISENEELSKDIKSYGTFDDIDTSLCNIDLSSVDNTKAGEYKYSVKCFKTEKESKIIVVPENKFKVTTKLTFKKRGSSVSTKSFVKEEQGYTYKLVNEADSKLIETGLKQIAVDVYDSNNNTQRVYGLVYVIKLDYLLLLECKKDNEINKMVIDYNQKLLGDLVKINEFIFEDEAALSRKVATITDGNITIDGYSGYAVVDYDNLKIQVVNSINSKSLTDLPTDYEGIKSYYKQKNYTCK